MRFWGIVILLLVPVSVLGDELCSAGYYLNQDAGECDRCGGAFYCPGDNMRYPCPAPDGRLMSDWPDDYYNPTIDSAFIYTEQNSNYYNMQKSIGACPVYYRLKSERGTLYTIRSYNVDTGVYDRYTTSWGWISVSGGYYLTNPKACWAWAYYYNAEPCPAGAYCPGMPGHRCDNYIQPDDYGALVCGDNSYSDAGAAECTPCPAGTGNAGNDMSDHAGVASCRPLCAAGATKMHVRNYQFNIWPANQCPSPALRIGFADGECCVNMVSGATDVGLNVMFNDAVYHTVN